MYPWWDQVNNSPFWLVNSVMWLMIATGVLSVLNLILKFINRSTKK